MPGRRRAVAALVLASAFAGGATLSAHRLDEYLQAARVGIEPDRLHLELDMTPGVAVADAGIVFAVGAGAMLAAALFFSLVRVEGRALVESADRSESPRGVLVAGIGYLARSPGLRVVVGLVAVVELCAVDADLHARTGKESAGQASPLLSRRGNARERDHQ